MKHVLYIHGFLSSPLSAKAQLTKAWLEEHYPNVNFLCPELSSYPDEAKQQLLNLIEDIPAESLCLIGSSLGGFWSTFLIENGYAHRAILVNPAVTPHERFTEFVGQSLKSYYSEQCYDIQQSHLDVLAESSPTQIQKTNRYWVWIQTGDEVLDYRLAVNYYKNCAVQLEEGGNHSFVGYEFMLPALAEYFQLHKS